MEENRNWFGITVDKHVSVGHIFTTLAAIVAGVSAYMGMINRIQNLEQADVRIEKEVQQIRTEHAYALDKIDNKLDKIYDKLDSKVDK